MAPLQSSILIFSPYNIPNSQLDDHIYLWALTLLHIKLQNEYLCTFLGYLLIISQYQLSLTLQFALVLN